MSIIGAFDEFVAQNKGNRISLQKLKNLTNPENRNSEIPMGEKFTGQVTLKYFEDSEYGDGFIIMVDGGFTMRTSMVREVIKKSPTKWLCKTLNSVYKVEVEVR